MCTFAHTSSHAWHPWHASIYGVHGLAPAVATHPAIHVAPCTIFMHLAHCFQHCKFACVLILQCAVRWCPCHNHVVHQSDMEARKFTRASCLPGKLNREREGRNSGCTTAFSLLYTNLAAASQPTQEHRSCSMRSARHLISQVLSKQLSCQGHIICLFEANASFLSHQQHPWRRSALLQSLTSGQLGFTTDW